MALVLAMVMPELAFQAAEAGLVGGQEGIGWRALALELFAFFPELFAWMAERGIWLPLEIARLVTYPFVHVSFMSSVFAIVFTLALGKLVGEAMSGLAVLVIFFGASVVAALVYWLALPDQAPLYGGMPGAYGLIGGFTFLLWLKAVATGGPQTQAFGLIAFLMGIQLFFGLFFDTGNAWVADLAGFFAGFGLSFFLVPGGFSRLMAFLRSR
jgi:membrane associated rhomboid family serine protease